jgi:radical SAM superfamily enzyme YgiQ (UPF0313 family)
MLVYLADPIHTYVGSQNSSFIPLSALNISAYIGEKFGPEVEVRVFKFPEKMMAAIDDRAPNIVGVSNYIWNYHLGRAILAASKTANPDVVTVMGGPNATLTEAKMSVMLADGLIDYYVPDNAAGGEITFAGLVQARLSGDGPIHESRDASGIWYFDQASQKARHIPSLPGTKTMDWLPSPFQSGLVDEFFEDGLSAMIETNRGCPFHCTFCVWGAQDTNSKVTQFSVDRVKQDLDYCSANVKQELLMINDANFGLFKKRDLEIARHIRKLNQEKQWPVSIVVNWGQVRSESSIAVADELKGITMLRQSSQSIDENVLEAIKRENVPDSQWRWVAEECRRDGIESFAELIVMLPGETFNSYINGLRYFFNLGIDCINSNQCQLLEGAEMNTEDHRSKYGVRTGWRLLENAYGKYGDYDCIEAEEVVIETNTFSFEENLKCRKLNWLIQMSWTLRRHNLILRMIMEQGVNPVDFLLYAIEHIDQAPTELIELFNEFEADSRNELFSSYQDLLQHYVTVEGIESLKSGGFKKLNTYYAGKALTINEKFIEFYCKMATEMVPQEGTPSAQFGKMLAECAKFCEARTLSARSITEIEGGSASEKMLSLCYDLPSWEVDPEGRPLEEFYVDIDNNYRIYTRPDQYEAIRNYLTTLPRKSKDYQLQKLCEPYYGIRKEHLNFSCQVVDGTV